MELEGLKRSLITLEDHDVDIKNITTDRHPQVQKFLKLNRPAYTHWYDCWHVAKGKVFLKIFYVQITCLNYQIYY